MPLINQVKSLKEQGLTNEQIIQGLQEQGFSPLEINQAIEQVNIKTAVSQNNLDNNAVGAEMQPSIAEYPAYPTESPLPMPEPQQQEEIQALEYAYPTPQLQASPQAYQTYQEYQPYSSSESITEIAEQIAEEKFNLIKKEIGNISEFKTISNKKLENFDERLKRIEEIIDKLQATIIGKIGNFSQNVQDIKEEMGMMQESFSKALNPLVEKSRGKASQEEKAETKHKRKSNGFEHYLRK